MKRANAILICITVAACCGCLGPNVQKPHSDVPVVSRIGWWAYQEGLTVTNLSVEVVDAPLQLFNYKALVRMHIAGTLHYEARWRPYIKQVHMGERFEPSNTNDMPVADFLVTPVVGVRQDRTYGGETNSFETKAETYFQTFGWGQNPYQIRCAGFHRHMTLTQMK